MASPRTAWDLAKEVVWSQRRRLAVGLLLLLVDRGAGMVVPLAPKFLVDDIIGKHRPDLLVWLAVAVIGAAAVQAVAVFSLTRILGLSAERVVLRWRRRVMARLTWFPIARIDDTQSGALVSRVMDDAASVQSLVGWDLVRWGSNILTALVALVALLWLDARITLVALVFVAIPGLGLHLAHRKLRPLFRERSKRRAEVSGRLTQTLGGLRIVKAYGAERREQLVFTRGLHRLYRAMSDATTKKSLMHAIATVVSAGVVAIVVVLGGQAMLDGRMTLGTFATYIAFALTFASPLLDLPDIATRISETLADLDRVRDIEEVVPEHEGDEARAALPTVKGDVAFEHVSFGYIDDVPVLRDVSFDAPAGTTTAIVGPSGSGKSTMLSLLMGFHRPGSGRVLVDGHDLAAIKLRDYRKKLGVVLQDELLFDGTIAENIAFARPTASADDIAAASKLAHCDEFVRTFEKGLATEVGERGVKLSGGQRQRVAIARAILADAPLLFLDEATSSLDSESEGHIKDALATLRRGRTTFVIAHRLSTIKTADQILVLEGGVVVERGTHDELLAVGGRYRALYEAQYGAPAASSSTEKKRLDVSAAPFTRS